jgi:hydroxymethylglutaryl-CoA lyase
MATFPKEPEVKIVECPRDAMQGILDFIPTETKIAYLNELLKVGFHTIDCGSFVSPKAIPQLRDTQELLNAIDLTQTDTKLSVIVANQRGVRNASKLIIWVFHLVYLRLFSREIQIRVLQILLIP